METWSGQEREGESFAEADFGDGDWTVCRFARCSVRGARSSDLATTRCTFTECDFAFARLNAARPEQTDFSNSRFHGGRLFNAEFIGCELLGCDFQEADLAALTVDGGDCSSVNLRFQDVRDRNLRGVRFAEADLNECNLEGVDLRDADPTHAKLDRSRFSGANLRGALLDGVDVAALDLRRVRLDLAQAVHLARSLGAIVDFDRPWTLIRSLLHARRRAVGPRRPGSVLSSPDDASRRSPAAAPTA